MKNKIHPMTKKGIKNFITKNNIDETYITKVDNLKTIEDLINFNESIKETQKDLFAYIQSKLKSKTRENPSEYLNYDIDMLKKVLENGNEEEILEEIKRKRNEHSDKLDINAYCIDNLANLVSITLKNLNLINADTCKRQDFLDVLDITQSKWLLKPFTFKYFSMSVNSTELSKDNIDYIFKYLRNNNVKKGIFNARDIKTTKDFTDHLTNLFKYLYEGNTKAIIDIYSTIKVFELFLSIL